MTALRGLKHFEGKMSMLPMERALFMKIMKEMLSPAVNKHEWSLKKCDQIHIRWHLNSANGDKDEKCGDLLKLEFKRRF